MATRRATICVARNGAVISVDNVPLADAAEVMADLLETFRLVQRAYPELIVELSPIGGSTAATSVVEDGWAEEGKKRVGF